jgi:hypothetical protein
VGGEEQAGASVVVVVPEDVVEVGQPVMTGPQLVALVVPVIVPLILTVA